MFRVDEDELLAAAVQFVGVLVLELLLVLAEDWRLGCGFVGEGEGGGEGEGVLFPG